ncbi:MAG: hypothetical protein BVN35_17175 [Proteobacteria bacterium ST_bin11]|nr:MAG: hypothetical protein BVN35_17175 [Proteobacteria bacterium ST_bin11]
MKDDKRPQHSEKNKTLKQSEMSENEKEVMGYFERMFTLEFYIRYLEINHSNDLLRAQRLNKIVTEKFIEFDKTHNLSEMELGLPYDTVDLPSFPVDIDYYVRWVLDKLEGPPITTECLPKKLDLSGLFFPENVRKFLSTQILPLKKYVKPSQKQLAFSFYDLTHPNDTNALFSWWCKHVNLHALKQNKILRDMSMKIEEPVMNDDGSYPSFSIGVTPDFLSPSVRLNAENRFRIDSTNTHSIKVNDQELSNAIVLSYQFDNDVGDYSEALDLFITNLRADFSTWQSKQLKSESISSHDLMRGKQPSSFLLPHQSDQYAKIISKYVSVTKNLLGLLCYDVKTKRNKTIDAAATDISDYIKNSFELDFDVGIIKKGYYSVLDKINVMDEVINLKQNRRKYHEPYKF